MHQERIRTSHGAMRPPAKIHNRFRSCLRLVQVYRAWGVGAWAWPLGVLDLGGGQDRWSWYCLNVQVPEPDRALATGHRAGSALGDPSLPGEGGLGV